MANRRGKGIYLGTTRRQKNAALRNLGITIGILLFVIVLSSFFVMWMLDHEDKLPVFFQEEEQQTEPPQGEGTKAAEPAETAAQTESVSSVQTEPMSPETEPPKDLTPLSSIMLTGTPYKVLDYTANWVVMLDPGHGFDDIGTSSALLGDGNEATITLDIALRLKALLEEQGVTVLMTHDTNAVDGRISAADGGEPPLHNLVLLPPEDRAVLANGQDIDLYLSIHCDSMPDHTDAAGMRLYYHKSPDFSEIRNAAAEALASRLAYGFDSVIAETVPLIKEMAAEDAYYVIRYIEVPSILCEVGFVTNPTDAASLLSPDWRQKAAQGLADGIFLYMTDTK